MTDRREKQRIMDLLRRAGLWEAADKYREAARQRLREEGKDKKEAVSAAWEAMIQEYESLLVEQEPAFQTILPDGAECFDDIVDPEYGETDPARQMRDAYVWIKEEFPRVVRDQPAGTVVDYRLFHTPPPMGLACNILETWAAKPRQKRDGLYREVRTCLATGKAPGDSKEELEPAVETHPYLDALGL